MYTEEHTIHLTREELDEIFTRHDLDADSYELIIIGTPSYE
jgi:alkylhydroperoxidase/carboxymuconolactone decarboxylase family protein YurZ